MISAPWYNRRAPPPRLFRARAAGETRRVGWWVSLKSCRTNALNVRFLADHVCLTPGGRHWRRVIGTSAADPGCVKTNFEARARNIDSHNRRRRQ